MVTNLVVRISRQLDANSVGRGSLGGRVEFSMAIVGVATDHTGGAPTPLMNAAQFLLVHLHTVACA